MNLYRWQKDCLNAWEENSCRGIVNVVTGAGKTVLALAAVKQLRERYPDLKVRIVVPTIPLANQWKQAVLRQAGEEGDIPGFYGGMRKDPPDQRYMIYIINSARTALSRHIRADLAVGNHVLLICDECHHYQSRENRRIFDFLTPEMCESPLYCSLGLSATPFADEKGYAAMQKFLRPDSGLEQSFSLFAFSSSYAEDVIDKKHDFDVVANIWSEEPDLLKASNASLNAILNAPELSPLTKEEIRQILVSIQDFHGRAYDWNPQISEETLLKASESGGYLLRTKIRVAIEFLDQLYQYGEAGETRITELGKECFDEEDEVPELGEL
ncbi:MAG: DEAD/DEAH box helicase family protein [Oscillospiraceae bacterium]|nr:DEAD/DEAH box helicase family protein [Oscillospiraceae bacterium]